MTHYKHLLCFDLSSYGTALLIINQFVDDDSVKVFEVSPCGEGGVLVLLANEPNSLVILKAQCESLFKSNILCSEIIHNMHPDLLPVYLSQNKPDLKNSMMLFEGNMLSLGLPLAQSILASGATLVDFRVIRTFPKNVIITACHAEGEHLMKINSFNFKKTFIAELHNSLKSYYEVR